MTPKNPDWAELKKEPFGPYIADEILQYRSDEIERIVAWKAENPLPEPVDVEIGSNRGCFLLGITRGQPGVSTLGIELKLGLCRIAQRKLAREKLANGHVIHADAKLAIPVLCRPNSVNAIYVLFPDPWWKRKHARRRLLDDGFFEMAHAFLKPGGCFVLKTDVLDYFDAVDDYLQKLSCFERIAVDDVPSAGVWTLSTRERHCIEDNLPYKSLAIRKLDVPFSQARASLAEAKLEKHNYRYHPEEKDAKK